MAKRTRKQKRRKTKVGRNDPCPCGSGRKHKHCCLATVQRAPQYTVADRQSALTKLLNVSEVALVREDDAAITEFWDPVPDYEGLELAEYAEELGEQVQQWWCWFDRPMADDRLMVDHVLDKDDSLTGGERRFLELARESCLRLYEVVDVVPGRSVTLHDVMDERQVTVVERMGSRSLQRATLLAARVMPGPGSTQAVMESGAIPYPGLAARGIVEQTRQYLREHLEDEPGATSSEFYKELVLELFRAWAQLLVEPPIPRLSNTDGEEMLWTRTHFEVLDAEALRNALDGHKELSRDQDEDTWRWLGRSSGGQEVSLGRVELSGAELLLETNSRERGERGRALVEEAAGELVAFRVTSHEDVRQRVIEGLRRGRAAAPTSQAPKEVPAELAEQLILSHQAKHYHGWLDEPLPALGGRTPRDAVASPELVPEVERLIRGIEGLYEQALRDGQPAYDPSWMWFELGLAEGEPPVHPPPLPHERWEDASPGWIDTSGKAAWTIRNRPGFDDRSTVATLGDLEDDLDVRRFRSQPERPHDVMERLRYGVCFELHRRKVFWVDESLAFMLAQTDLDVDGDRLRVPFPAFALVFTDRHTLSLAERLLATDEACPIRGYLLRAATVYVVEEADGDARVLHLGFALDTRGEDPPHLVEHRIRLEPGAPVDVQLENPVAELDGAQTPSSAPALPLPGLLQITLNAILYAVSPASEKIPRQSPAREGQLGRGGPAAVFTSDDVFHLPGQIPISQIRQLQRLDHHPNGRSLMTRHMVRGHWRRPAKSWKDQRMRWIQPYWKGPDIVAIIERTYRLEL